MKKQLFFVLALIGLMLMGGYKSVCRGNNHRTNA